MDVQAWQDNAQAPGVGQLVCVNPFPSRPLGFFGDPEGTAFHAAYFTANPPVWTHGDLIEFTPSGGARLHGRCDGVMNVRGIKVMPAEICRVLQDDPEVRACMVVEWTGDPPGMMALLELREDAREPQAARAARLRREIARRISPAHVPDRIMCVPELPLTHSGKLSEAAARYAVNGLPVPNRCALRNPQCLDALRAQALAHCGTRAREASARDDLSDAPLEARLQALWCEELDLDHVGLDDHFLEIGGNSLQAAVIMVRLEQMTGRNLPLATLLQAPTVRALTAAVRALERAAPPSPLVTLREGYGPPLILVHGLSGTVMECGALVEALRTRRPVLGLHAQGLDGEAAPHERVEAMAAHYVETLRRARPGERYALCGFSFGGLVALEMARLLAFGGERVDLLCLLEGHSGPVHSAVLTRKGR
jgi:acetoacetyl-CoA synthetase